LTRSPSPPSGSGQSAPLPAAEMAVLDQGRRFLALAGGFLEYPCAVHALSAPPLRRFRLVNVHTTETFDGPYRDDLGPIGLALEELSLLLRDHHSGEQIAIDISVIDFLTALMEAIGASRATVLSAYRGVATNRA